MKFLILVLFTLPSLVHAETNQAHYTPECIAWAEQVDLYLPVTKTQNLDQAIAKADPVRGLELIKRYPGDSPRYPERISDSSSSNHEKLKQWSFYPNCPVLKFFDIGKTLNQAKLTLAQAKEFRASLFANLARDEQNQSSFITLVVDRSLVGQAIENHKISLNEAEEFEWLRLVTEIARLQEGAHEQQMKLCSNLSFCWPWDEADSVRYYSRLYSEMRHIRSEMSLWARHVEGQAEK
jgi:hypothetical protein